MLCQLGPISAQLVDGNKVGLELRDVHLALLQERQGGARLLDLGLHIGAEVGLVGGELGCKVGAQGRNAGQVVGQGEKAGDLGRRPHDYLL